MAVANNYDEAERVLTEAEHNPAGERLISQAGVRALLAIADEIRALREAVVAGPGSLPVPTGPDGARPGT
jgi:hypothetical protein